MSSLICVSCLSRYKSLRKELQLLERWERRSDKVRKRGKHDTFGAAVFSMGAATYDVFYWTPSIPVTYSIAQPPLPLSCLLPDCIVD